MNNEIHALPDQNRYSKTLWNRYDKFDFNYIFTLKYFHPKNGKRLVHIILSFSLLCHFRIFETSPISEFAEKSEMKYICRFRFIRMKLAKHWKRRKCLHKNRIMFIDRNNRVFFPRRFAFSVVEVKLAILLAEQAKWNETIGAYFILNIKHIVRSGQSHPIRLRFFFPIQNCNALLTFRVMHTLHHRRHHRRRQRQTIHFYYFWQILLTLWFSCEHNFSSIVEIIPIHLRSRPWIKWTLRIALRPCAFVWTSKNHIGKMKLKWESSRNARGGKTISMWIVLLLSFVIQCFCLF